LRKYNQPGPGRWSKPLIAFADPVFGADKEENNTGSLKHRGMTDETKLAFSLLTRSTGRGELERLPDSATEARAIAEEVKGREKDIYLREKASEANVYSAELSKCRYLLFSTHGLLGGDFSGVEEPSLALTLTDNPPGKDGFLSMSEVLGLDLNTEIVILSACSTTGRGEKASSGEGFAGLTRSFMYAGGRSLLVTHWNVESTSARDLMVATFRELKVSSGPDALRQAKLDMKGSTRKMKDGRKLSLSHPFFWAPFVFVGEGKSSSDEVGR
jgi:CHAT domain-containing protein